MLPTSAPAFRCSRPPTLSRLFAAIPLLFALTPIAHAFDPLSDIPDSTYVTDGPINAITRSDSTIYIAGQFTRIGPRTGPGIEVALNGSQPAGQPEVSGSGVTLGGGSVTGVRAVVDDGAGGWYVSGLFSHVGGLPRSNIVHILANRTVDAAFAPTVDGAITSLALSGTTLYVGGLFTTISGQTRSNIAALSTVDGSATTFNPNANAAVSALALSADNATLYVGGASFTNIGGQARNGLAAIDTVSGTASVTFLPLLARTSASAASVDSIALGASTIYVSGNFDTVGGVARRTIAALNTSDGALVTGFAPAPTLSGCIPCATVSAVSLSGTTLFVGGSFAIIGGQARKNLAGLDVATGLATDFDPTPSANLISLKVVGSTVYVGGGFQTIGGQPRSYFAALDASSGAALALNPGPNGTVSAIGVNSNGIYLGGMFSSIGGVARTSLAAINPATGVPTDWNPNPANGGNGVTLKSLTLDGSLLYVGGTYQTIGGQTRKNLSAVSTVDGLANTFNPTSSGAIESIVVTGSSVFAGGSFTTIGGQSRFFLAELNSGSGLASAFNANLDSTVASMVLVGTTLYAGGSFYHIGGQVRDRLGAVDILTGVATSWDPALGTGDFGTYVRALSLSGNTLYVGGGFGAAGGSTRKNTAAFDISTGSLTSFNPEASLGSNGGSVYAIASDGNTVYLGGDFAAIGGQPRGKVAAVSAADGSVLPFNPNISGNAVYTLLAAPNGSVYVGGSYQTYNLAYQSHFAKFSPELPLDILFRNGFDTP